MKSPIIIRALLCINLCSFVFIQYSSSQITSKPVKIVWVTHLKGDFSFTKKWSYPEGVYKNEYGQLSCDGLCPPEIDNMKDDRGKIYEDSLRAFYKYVDTAHLQHTISSDAWCYEWAGTNFIDVYRMSNDMVFCKTLTNVATHCSLELTIKDDNCVVVIDLASIVAGGNAKFYCTNGNIIIDKDLWKQGILKATFNLNFGHQENPKKPIYWKGKIYSKINSL